MLALRYITSLILLQMPLVCYGSDSFSPHLRRWDEVDSYNGISRRRHFSMSEEPPMVKEASCQDSTEDFTLRNQGVKMNCNYLDSNEYQFACTYVQVREMVS